MNLAAILPILIGFLLDALLGDPHSLPHPVRFIGGFVNRLERCVRKKCNDLRLGGFLIVMTVIIASGGMAALIVIICYHINVITGIIAEGLMCYYLLAARSLRDESMKVYRAIHRHDTEGARKAVSMIVGRDTKSLDEQGVIRAAVETVAENTSDGVTAPLFYMMFGGAVGGFVYKAVNTMDSMLGYKNDKYKDIGYFPAKLDDIFNYVPSRITALLCIPSVFLCGLDGKNAYRIWKRDRRKHASPNSAQTEAAFAGALHVQLAGDAYYFGELHKKPYIGDNDRPIQNEDIKKANRMMYIVSLQMLIISCAIRGLIL